MNITSASDPVRQTADWRRDCFAQQFAGQTSAHRRDQDGIFLELARVLAGLRPRTIVVGLRLRPGVEFWTSASRLVGVLGTRDDGVLDWHRNIGADSDAPAVLGQFDDHEAPDERFVKTVKRIATSNSTATSDSRFQHS